MPGIGLGHRMNSRSDSRFRYFAVSGFTVSSCSAYAAQALRSARRVTVRAVCSSAAAGVPPGSTKLRSTGSPSLYWSQACSSRSM